jgi:two-component system, response regulator
MEINPTEIILVEDNPSDAELTIRALRKNNLSNEIVHLKDGTEALDYLFSKGQFATRQGNLTTKLILLDIKMPKVDGRQLLKIIKADPALNMIPVVVLTSSREERDIFESYKLGVNSYIVKPVEFDKFIEVVRHLGLYWTLYNQTPK